MPDIADMQLDAHPTWNDIYLETLEAEVHLMGNIKEALEDMQKMRRGNPKWYKGMKAPNPYGRNGKPSFMVLVVKGLENFLSSPFAK
jgi:hypothetical protein